MDIQITEPQTEAEFEEYYRLRWDRLRRPHDQPEGSERDSPHEPKSKHLIAKVDGRIVGAECYVVLSGRRGRLRRRRIIVRSRQTAVVPELERSGVATALLRYVEERGREIGAYEVIGNVREEALSWGKSMGYEVRDEGTSLYGTVKSYAMFKRL
jgi:GNAT superfamily N-acetyltransferase